MNARTKTVATVGPASLDRLEELVRAGVDIIRLNLAHGSPADHARSIRRVRAAERTAGRPLGILADLPGPKIRLGELGPDGRRLSTGERVVLTGGRPAPGEIPVRRPALARDVRPGHRIFLADGAVRLRVEGTSGIRVLTRVEAGGALTSRAGVNLVDGAPDLSAFTDNDAALLRRILPRGIDFIGISFVGNAEDVQRVRRFLRGRPRPPLLIAKIERARALENLEEIVAASDGVMVARGDLGVELDYAEVPAVQRRIVETAERMGKPALVATQMLESMMRNPRPTRAEATDIANAVLEGADALVLSGETSVGLHPVEAVRALNNVIARTEARADRRPEPPPRSEEDRLALEARHWAERLGARWILVASRTGATAVRVARARGVVPVLALVRDDALRRRLTLHGGLESLRVPLLPRGRPDDRVFDRALRRVHGLRRGDRVVFFGRFHSSRGTRWFLETTPV